MSASAALEMAEMPPPMSAETPGTRPHTAKQMSAATTVTTTWPSTTLIASRLAWGNSRVTTTLLLQVDNPRTQKRVREIRRRALAVFENCFGLQRLTVPWPRGAHYIHRPPQQQHENRANPARRRLSRAWSASRRSYAQSFDPQMALGRS